MQLNPDASPVRARPAGTPAGGCGRARARRPTPVRTRIANALRGAEDRLDVAPCVPAEPGAGRA